VRVTAVFNRLLGFAGTVVRSVAFGEDSIVVRLGLRSRLLVCPCGRRHRAGYDRSVRRWRHVNFGHHTVLVEAEVRRVDCAGCGQVRTEWTSWARPGARHTTAFENQAAWLATQMPKTRVAEFMGTSWRTVTAIAARLVGAHLDGDRLSRLRRIGVDEIAYRKGRKFLTLVADHDTGHVVWIGEGRSGAVLDQFYQLLPEQTRRQIRAVSMDLTRIWRQSTRTALPTAVICFDPFHVITWAGEALEATRAGQSPDLARMNVPGLTPAQAWRKVRATVRAAAENLDPTGRAIIAKLRQTNPRLHRAWRLKEDLRQLYKIKPKEAAAHLNRWIGKALRSDLNGFVTLARRIRRNDDGILAAVHKRLSNSLVEGINAGIRLIQRRAHGYAKLDNLITMIYLCHGGVPIRAPTGTS
jgi:transposase